MQTVIVIILRWKYRNHVDTLFESKVVDSAGQSNIVHSFDGK